MYSPISELIVDDILWGTGQITYQTSLAQDVGNRCSFSLTHLVSRQTLLPRVQREWFASRWPSVCLSSPSPWWCIHQILSSLVSQVMITAVIAASVGNFVKFPTGPGSFWAADHGAGPGYLHIRHWRAHPSRNFVGGAQNVSVSHVRAHVIPRNSIQFKVIRFSGIQSNWLPWVDQ